MLSASTGGGGKGANEAGVRRTIRYIPGRTLDARASAGRPVAICARMRAGAVERSILTSHPHLDHPQCQRRGHRGRVGSCKVPDLGNFRGLFVSR
jgi:hypothetical protein